MKSALERKVDTPTQRESMHSRSSGQAASLTHSSPGSASAVAASTQVSA
ncbi:MAG: hypothetical protein R2939_22925 [Kofleriaceae bacterium]